MKKFYSITFVLFLTIVHTLQAQQVITIAQARALGAGLAHNQNGDTVTVRGIVTTGQEFGIIRYLQDATAGIAAYGTSVSSLLVGDSIEVRGVLKNFRMLLELDPVISFNIISQSNPLPQPKILSMPSAFSEAFESQLVQVQGVTTTSTGNFAGNTNYNIVQGAATNQMRVNAGTNLVGTAIPSGQFNVTGVMSQFTVSTNPNLGYQLLPRSTADLSSGVGPILLSDLDLISHTQNSLTVGFSTATPATATWFYGLTNPPTQVLVQSNASTNHTVTISNLAPASFYFVRCAAINGTDTTFTTTKYYTTISLSSGQMRAIFTRPVNTALATTTPAVYSARGVDDSLIALINTATQTVDIAIYNLNNNGLSDMTAALNAAHARGVRVRMVADGSTAMVGLNSLNSQIGRIRSPQGSQFGLMHNKFVLIDAAHSDPFKPMVWTGSTNLTADQINVDANNVVIIQDQALALAFQIEFEEMFGSNTAQPNATNARFGQFKRDNTPKIFTIGGKRIRLFFSPSDDVENNILNGIATANHEIAFATMLITRNGYPNTMIGRIAASNVLVAGVQNDTANGGTQFNMLRNHPAIGANRMRLYTVNGILHHKYCLVDYASPQSNPLTITGSHNWSASANDRNDENTLIIDDADLANQFYQEWHSRFTESGGLITQLITTDKIPLKLVGYPNPTTDFLNLSSNQLFEKLFIRITNLHGAQVLPLMQFENTQFVPLDLSTLQAGFYLIHLSTPSGSSSCFKVIKQ